MHIAFMLTIVVLLFLIIKKNIRNFIDEVLLKSRVKAALWVVVILLGLTCYLIGFVAINQDGVYRTIAEIMMKVLVFVPVGLLLGCAFRSITWWKVMLIGGVVSVLIETMQFFFKRGFSEVDDVMHNTTGCILGYILIQGSRFMVKGYNKIHG